MITIFIDNRPYEVAPDQNLLQACLSLGIDLPYFCWHPAMHSVGACRQCAVKLFRDEKDEKGKIVMSCMTAVSEGMRLSVDDADARAFRSSVIEWLMLNHPHDCPVCDEGGECHLQDMTVMAGHAYRRSRFPKRTHRNQDLGPFINHEMNRCIQCYRCVRFYRGYAGGRDLNVFSAHDHVYFGRHEDGALESEFSGNLVEICPTGVFTDRTLKEHFTRKWDLQTAPSICVHCATGCNTIAGERSGSLRRILNRYHRDVNGYFLCDRGRFGYEFVNSEKRIRAPLISSSPARRAGPPAPTDTRPLSGGETAKTVSRKDSLRRIAEILARSKGTIGIGSPRASLESNFALRTLVGPDRYYAGMSPQEQRLVEVIIDVLASGPARTPTLNDVRRSDAVLLLGEDVTNTAPLLSLSLRQSVRQKGIATAAKVRIPAWDDSAVRHAAQDEKSPVYIAAAGATKLDDIATGTYRAAPDDIARLGFAVAHEIDRNAPSVPGLSGDVRSLAKEIAAALRAAARPVIVSGIGCRSEAVVRAAANVAWALCATGSEAQLSYAVHECNTTGVGLLQGRNIGELLRTTDPVAGTHRGYEADTLIILENDLFRRDDAAAIGTFLERFENVIVLDHIRNRTTSRADIVLPAATFAEANGTLVSTEGRAQRSYQVMAPQGDIQESWKWIHDIMKAARMATNEADLSWDGLVNSIASEVPVFGPIRDIAPPADFTITGLKVPRQPHRYSGRTALQANISVHEPKPPGDEDSPLAFSMEGHEGRPPSSLINRYWAPGWNSVQALTKFQQEAGGSLLGGDPGTRLIEPARDGKPAYFPAAADGAGSTAGGIEAPPPCSLFGSEELSALSPSIRARRSRS